MTAPAKPPRRLSRLAPLDEAFAAIDTLAKPVAACAIDVATAQGRVLAANVAASAALPASATALRDGWAVRSDLLTDAGAYAPTPLVPAPDWVEVGDPLRAGADAVVAPDAVTTDGKTALALAPAVPGEGVLAAGADAAPGETMCRAGAVIRAIDVAVLRAAGITRVHVRAPNVAIVCADAAMKPARDVVGTLIARLVEADGSRVHDGWPGGERASDLASALRRTDIDAVIGIGGTGLGRRDDAVDALARHGKVFLHGIGLIPGDTAAIGSVGTRPVLLLPGRLDAALAVYLVLGRRLVARLTGRTSPDITQPVKLARKIVSTVGMAEVVPVRRSGDAVEPVAGGFFPLRAMAWADGYVLVPADSEGFPQDAVVEMRALP